MKATNKQVVYLVISLVIALGTLSYGRLAFAEAIKWNLNNTGNIGPGFTNLQSVSGSNVSPSRSSTTSISNPNGTIPTWKLITNPSTGKPYDSFLEFIQNPVNEIHWETHKQTVLQGALNNELNKKSATETPATFNHVQELTKNLPASEQNLWLLLALSFGLSIPALQRLLVTMNDYDKKNSKPDFTQYSKVSSAIEKFLPNAYASVTNPAFERITSKLTQDQKSTLATYQQLIGFSKWLMDSRGYTDTEIYNYFVNNHLLLNSVTGIGSNATLQKQAQDYVSLFTTAVLPSLRSGDMASVVTALRPTAPTLASSFTTTTQIQLQALTTASLGKDDTSILTSQFSVVQQQMYDMLKTLPSVTTILSDKELVSLVAMSPMFASNKTYTTDYGTFNMTKPGDVNTLFAGFSFIAKSIDNYMKTSGKNEAVVPLMTTSMLLSLINGEDQKLLNMAAQFGRAYEGSGTLKPNNNLLDSYTHTYSDKMWSFYSALMDQMNNQSVNMRKSLADTIAYFKNKQIEMLKQGARIGAEKVITAAKQAFAASPTQVQSATISAIAPITYTQVLNSSTSAISLIAALDQQIQQKQQEQQTLTLKAQSLDAELATLQQWKVPHILDKYSDVKLTVKGI